MSDPQHTSQRRPQDQRPRPPKVPRPDPLPRVASAFVARLAPDDVAAFWESGPTLPIMEAGDAPGTSVVTFLWRDRSAGRVLLFANRLTDETQLDATLLARLGNTDLWHASFVMSSDWRASYAFLRADAGGTPPWQDARGHASLRAALDHGHADPYNPDTCRNRAGITQSVVSLPAAPAQPWLAPRPGTPTGTVTTDTGPDGRLTHLYNPPGATPDEQLPLLVVLDGEVWNGNLRLPTTLDNLINADALRPIRAVFLTSGTREDRWRDLSSDGSGVTTVVEELLPWCRARTAVSDHPRDIAVMGQSLGGLTSLRAGLLHPDRVGVVISHSASLWQDDLAGLTAHPSGAKPRVFLSCGLQEWLLLPYHRSLAARLDDAGIATYAEEFNGGHDYACWRGGVADALVWAWGPPGR